MVTVWLFSHYVLSDTSQCRGLQHARLPFLCYFPEFAQIHVELVMPSSHLTLCHPLLLLLSVFPSIRDFSNESSVHIRWPKYWSFSFSISPSTEYLGLISFRIVWFYLLAVQGALKSTIIWKHQFFSAQPSLGEGNGNPLQYSCLESPMDKGAWSATVQGSQRFEHN